MAYTHENKKPGQLIRSADWNTMGNEVQRLGSAKVDRAGDTIKGPLTVGAPTKGATVQIINKQEDANGGALVLGQTSGSNLRLGYHGPYTWIQSHANKPLAINPLGNNVGIGTTTPGAKLHVSGGSLFEGGRNHFKDSENKGRVRVGAVWGVPGFYSEDGQDIVLGVAANRKAFIGAKGNFMTVQGNGNVGIGTATPAKKLHIQGLSSAPLINDGSDRPGLAITGHYPELNLFSGINNPAHGPTIRLGAYNDDSKTSFKHWVIGTAGRNASFLDIGFSDKNDANPHAGIRNYQGSTFLTLLENGNVGIGTTNPQEVLHISANRAHLRIEDKDGEDSFYIYPWSGGVNLYKTGNKAHPTYFGRDGDGSNWVFYNGNVGIGKTDPGNYKLNVNGDVYVSGVVNGAANEYVKAQFTMSGGGTVTWGGPDKRLKWTRRFIAIPVGRPTVSSSGYIDIIQPTTSIPAGQVYDGSARSATTNGVVLKGWEALYAVHTVGGNQSAVSFQIVRYTHNFSPPSNWLLVAAVNPEDNTVKLGTGEIVGVGTRHPGGAALEPWTTIYSATSRVAGAIKFQNGWVNYSGAYNSAAFYKDSMGIVHLKGLVKSGTIGQLIFTLPAGYKPPRRELHAVCTHPNAIGRVDILSDGRIYAVSGHTNWISLDGITFRV